MRTAGTWSEIRDEARTLPEALKTRQFSPVHGIPDVRASLRPRQARNEGAPPVSRRGRRALVGTSLQVKLVCGPGDRKGETILQLGCFPGLGETIEDEKGRRFLIVGIMAIGNGQYDALLFVRRQQESDEKDEREQAPAEVAQNGVRANIVGLRSASKQLRNT